MINSIKINGYKSIKNDIIFDFSNTFFLSILFGANQSGKTTIFDALKQFKNAFVQGMRGVDRLNNQTPTTYEFEFLIDREHFVYKTIINYDKADILYESLILKTKTTSYVYYIRDQYEITLGERLEKLFTAFDFDRFKTYLYDLKFDRREFILSHLRIKDFSDSQNALILNKIIKDIMQIKVFIDHEDIRFYSDLSDSHYVSVLNFIKQMHPNISSLQYQDVTLDELRFNLNRHRYDHLLDAYRSFVTNNTTQDFFVKVYNQFYKLSGRTLEELTIKSIEIHYKDGNILDYAKASSGIKKILLLSMILMNAETNDLILMDDLTKDLDHQTTIVLVNELRKILKLKPMKVVFSSQNILLLDQMLFDLKEILYTIYKDEIKLYNLSKLGIRKDKKLLNLYLEGFFNTLT